MLPEGTMRMECPSENPAFIKNFPIELRKTIRAHNKLKMTSGSHFRASTDV